MRRLTTTAGALFAVLAAAPLGAAPDPAAGDTAAELARDADEVDRRHLAQMRMTRGGPGFQLALRFKRVTHLSHHRLANDRVEASRHSGQRQRPTRSSDRR